MSKTMPANIADTAPRYTSYPTAPHFHSGVTGEIVRRWLAQVRPGEDVSLYIHIPFCDRLCWFCACHTKQTLRYEPVSAFLQTLYREISTVGGLLGDAAPIRAVHFGGGSPTMLKPRDIVALDAALRGAFAYRPGAEISVEIDPNDMDEGRLDALAAIGMTRASLGIQDFDERVQKAINREQSFEQTQAVVEGLRSRGVGSINLDLLYGLPHQTQASLRATIDKALSLRPDRMALFGYAHVPWFKKHQTMIDEAALPDPAERYRQSRLAAGQIREAGYEAIGIDHFALPGDALAAAAREGRLHRNFQGYTVDDCPVLIGLGPSSISRFPQGYAQNMPATSGYGRMVGDGGLATVRGIELGEDDRLHAWAIERLMCDFSFSLAEARQRFGNAADMLRAEALACAAGEWAGYCHLGDEIFMVADEGRPFVRMIASFFDRHLRKGGARYSAAV